MFDGLDDFMDLIGLEGIDFLGEDDADDEIEPFDIGSALIVGDSELQDLDGDGIAETLIANIDMDGDGTIDGLLATTPVDTDLDGTMDTFIEQVDFGGDGTIEISQVSQDIDGDFFPDYLSQDIYVDTDGDGIFDEIQNFTDYDGDGFFDEMFIEPLEELDDVNGMGYDFDDTYENFDPADYDEDFIIGDPVESMDNWHVQQDGGSCAVVSQEFALENLTGEEFDEADLCAYAHEMGWFEYGANGGTYPEDIGNILEAFGFDVSKSTGNDEDDLREALQNGGQVIVGVDADELWYGDNDFILPGDGANHAIQVIGMDYSDPDDPKVIINDSGTPDGCGAMVSLDDFLDAWEDSDSFMTVAY